MKKYFVIIAMCFAVNACSDNEPENLMSPCVGANGSPCDHLPLNQHLIQKQNVKA
jgi:hypothetical protein